MRIFQVHLNCARLTKRMTKKQNSLSTIQYTTAIALIVFGAAGRYALKDLPNIETITVVALLAGSLLSRMWMVIVPLAVVAVTDIFIGNTSILLYTWSAWAVTGLFGAVVKKRQKKSVRHAFELTGMGVLANFFFYLWTNFGVWHIGGLYPHTLDGLVLSYIAGLPFLRLQLLSTLAIVPIVSMVALALWNRLPAFLANIHTQKTDLTPEYVRAREQ